MDKVCAIIVTYNSMQWINECLSSLESSQYPIDYVIIDNDSSDETIDFIKKKFSPEKIFENGRNLGFGKANNLGLKWAYQAGYDYYFLVNQDVYINHDVVSALIVNLKKEASYGILSPIHMEGSGMKLDRWFAGYLHEHPTLMNEMDQGELKHEVYSVRFVNAACWMLTRRTLEKVGVFHPLFFHYGEDDNYVDRLRAEGMSLGVVPSVFIRHDRNQNNESSLKTDVGLLIRRNILNELIRPGFKFTRWSGYPISIKQAKKIYKWNKLKFGMWAYMKSLSIYISVGKEIREFNRNDSLAVGVK